jgi:hypothetical protein
MLEEYENLASNLSVNALVDQIHSSGAPAWTEARRCEPWKTPPGARLERGYRLQQTQETDELE